MKPDEVKKVAERIKSQIRVIRPRGGLFSALELEGIAAVAMDETARLLGVAWRGGQESSDAIDAARSPKRITDPYDSGPGIADGVRLADGRPVEISIPPGVRPVDMACSHFALYGSHDWQPDPPENVEDRCARCGVLRSSPMVERHDEDGEPDNVGDVFPINEPAPLSPAGIGAMVGHAPHDGASMFPVEALRRGQTHDVEGMIYATCGVLALLAVVGALVWG